MYSYCRNTWLFIIYIVLFTNYVWFHRCRKSKLCKTYDNIIGPMASQITSLNIIYSTVYSGADQRKLQSSASLAFVQGIHRWTVNSPHKWPVARNMFTFDDVIMAQVDCKEPAIMHTNPNSCILRSISYSISCMAASQLMKSFWNQLLSTKKIPKSASPERGSGAVLMKFKCRLCSSKQHIISGTKMWMYIISILIIQ